MKYLFLEDQEGASTIIYLFLYMQLIKARMKKVLTVLMAFYVLVLVFAPCVDHDLTVDPNPRPVINTATLPIHQDQHDCCTPFCTCSCCSAPFELLKAFIISQDFFQNGTLTFFFNSRFQTRYDFTIWEPPKA
ncbi:MAG: hypothetical protein D4R97_04635 [Bacteroidetes bacterium]|nr:MAG: hypothetical protein D4R97_04635 [Bacteroidota bacterium]